MASPIVRRVSFILSDPDAVIEIDEDFVFTRGIPNTYIEEGDQIFSFNKNKCSKGFTKENFLQHVEKKKAKDPESALTIIFLKKKDLNHPDIVRCNKVCCCTLLFFYLYRVKYFPVFTFYPVIS